MNMDNVTREILDKVKEVLKQHPSGEKFFDALDGEIIGNASNEVLEALFKTVPDGHFMVLSGGFGKRVAKGIDNGEFPKMPYILFRGGIRSGAKPCIIRSKRILPSHTEGIFLDDSIYGGATYYAIQKVFTGRMKLNKCSVIYDGCPIKKDYVVSLFRYYDHFSATPNYKF
jgi:hypothetical protein